MKSWNGVVVAVDNGANAREDNYRENKFNDFIEKLRYPFSIITFLLIIYYTLFFSQDNLMNLFSFFFLTKLMGIMASLPLMIRLFDKKNQFVKRLCATNNIESKANCSSILDSPNAFLFKVITWSEVGFIYFTSMFLFLLSFRRPESGIIVSSVSILVSPYIIYSIYYQWRIAKIWCRICLMVQLILFVELVSCHV